MIERAPVHSDPHRFLVFHRDLYHPAEILVVTLSRADVAWIDAVFGERSCALRILGEQNMPVVVKVTDNRNPHSAVLQTADDFRNRPRGLMCVDRDAHQLGARRGQPRDLIRGRPGIGRIGVGHGLDHDRGPIPDKHSAHAHTG